VARATGFLYPDGYPKIAIAALKTINHSAAAEIT
jgi:hypothetical protein